MPLIQQDQHTTDKLRTESPYSATTQDMGHAFPDAPQGSHSRALALRGFCRTAELQCAQFAGNVRLRLSKARHMDTRGTTVA